MNISKITDAIADLNQSLEAIADQIEGSMDFELIDADHDYEARYDDLMMEVEKMKTTIAEQLKELRDLID
jgi:DNA-binding HxlR family transcriptional regulator